MEWVPPVSVQKRCDVIISVSNIVREHAMSVYQHPKNEVIYDSISLSHNKYQESTKKKKISSVAALFPNKGHDNRRHDSLRHSVNSDDRKDKPISSTRCSIACC